MFSRTQVAVATPATTAVPVAAPAVPVQAAPAPVVVAAGPGNLPPGGSWHTEQYSGMITLICFIVVLIIFWPACAAPFCCPCDTREVYMLKDGRKFTKSGAVVPNQECCGNPCGGPSA